MNALAKVIFLIFLISTYNFSIVFAEISPDIYKKSAQLLTLEKDYILQRAQQNWSKIYNYQHPRYKHKISFEEFKYFNGRLDFNFREKTPAHISGARIPTAEEIKKRGSRKDIMGIPVKPHYRWLIIPLFTYKGHEIERIYISPDGQRAKIQWHLEGREQLDPRWARGYYDYPVRRIYFDYWEMTEEGWRIAVAALAHNVSGHKTIHYMVPADQAEWDRTEFIELTPAEINTNNPAQTKETPREY
ncbi:MAG: hypothetical protein COV66_11520 [Nitrospinae bacterium CG11_big_fil_rev_8_21_14_0_20_45_15]|nr:MAG: hypothetical protein COV66_11520 [Nitrospinae bacterium CG11_big_fil_rev_8_21_14_0_20_45_15]